MSSDRIMVRPGEDRRVRLEDGRILTPDKTPKEGVSAPLSIYVQRRLACGDLVEVKDNSQLPVASSQKPAAATTDNAQLKTGN